MTPWLQVIGIGADGWPGLSPEARTALEAAEVVIGGARHHDIAPHLKAERVFWPSPFRAMVAEIRALRPRPTAVLVTGDPLWFSAGAQLAAMFPAEEIAFHPHVSAFQLAAAAMRWSLADVETLTVHGRPPEQIVPWFADGARLLVLGQDAATPGRIAALLREHGLAASEITVLEALGAPDASRHDGAATDTTWPPGDFHTLAITCRATPGTRPLPRTGLPDDAYEHDGQLTKRETRFLTLARLEPRRRAVLWDIGAGCGSVSIEWIRAAPDATAFALEPDPTRRAMAARNAQRLGAPRLTLIDGRAPEALANLPPPDAIFIGGGLSRATAETALAALKPLGRLVANAVTLDSESLLAALHAEHGGDLTRLATARAEPLGTRRGWRPAMPVTQWTLTR